MPELRSAELAAQAPPPWIQENHHEETSMKFKTPP
jgi:hypothetical protein